jgi:gluconolactonase
MERTDLESVEVLAEGLAFPEGPVALADGSVLVVEIAAGRVTRVESDGRKHTVAEVGGGPNGAALGPDGALYICNNGGMSRRGRSEPSIQRLELATGQVDVLYTQSDGLPLQAPNDIVFDAVGGFWFTDFGGDSIHYATVDGSGIETAIRWTQAPNGVGLAPSGDVLYWSETYTRQLHRRKLSGPGQVVTSPSHDVPSLIRGTAPDPWTVVIGLPGRQQFDSLAVEGSGAVCIGTLIEGGVTVVGPDGDHDFYSHPIMAADGAVTNICFGGDDLRTAYVTCSVTGLLLRCRWPRPGLRLNWQS